MKSKTRINILLIALFFSILISWIFNGIALFVPQWNMDYVVVRYGHPGLLPPNFQANPIYFNAVTLMMILSFCSTVCIFLFYILSVFATFRRSNRASKLGFLIIAGLAPFTAFLQIGSFIIILIGFSGDPTTQVGICEYVALASGIVDSYFVLPLAIILSTTDFKVVEPRNQRESGIEE